MSESYKGGAAIRATLMHAARRLVSRPRLSELLIPECIKSFLSQSSPVRSILSRLQYTIVSSSPFLPPSTMDTCTAIPLLTSPTSALYTHSIPFSTPSFPTPTPFLLFQLLHFQHPSLRVTISRRFASLVPLPHLSHPTLTLSPPTQMRHHASAIRASWTGTRNGFAQPIQLTE